MADLSFLPECYKIMLDVLSKTPKGNDRGVPHILAIDAEYELGENRKNNDPLMYQFAGISPSGYCEGYHIAVQGKRLTIKQLIKLVLKSMYGSNIPKEKLQIILVAHHSGAEVSMLADRDEVRKSLIIVRGSATTKKQIKMRIGKTEVFVRLFDTKLLSPVGAQGLAELGELLGDEAGKKIEIDPYYKSRMSELLRDNLPLFIEYGMQDARVTLMAFLYLQQSLNLLAFGEFRRLFKTISSASVSGFLDATEGVKEYFEKLRGPEFREAQAIFREGFFGGMCTNSFIGSTRNYPPTKTHKVVDCDLISAYPSCMNLVPMVDTDRAPNILRVRYEITDENQIKLQEIGVSDSTIDTLRNTLLEKPEEYVSTVYRVARSQKQGDRMIQITTAVDNSLINDWLYRSRFELDEFHVPTLSHSILGCARIRFHFPEHISSPSLPIWHATYGLSYVRTGETIATAAEIVTAMEAGAEIDAVMSVELPVLRDEKGLPQFLIRDHLKLLVDERSKHPKKSVMNLLYKEAVNSFYGKFGQSINPRKVTEISDFKSRILGKSPITDPVIATITTGNARAALAAMRFAIDRFNQNRPPESQIYIISVTTDGALLAVPAEPDFDINEVFYIEEASDEAKILSAIIPGNAGSLWL